MPAFQEYHDISGKKEFCRESGPLKTKEASFPAAALQLLSAALAVAVLAVLIAALGITTALQAIYPTSAEVRVRIQNLEEGELVRYELIGPGGAVADEGFLDDPKELLRFTDLTPNTTYTLYYYGRNTEDVDVLIDWFPFTTADGEAPKPDLPQPVPDPPLTPPDQPELSPPPEEPEEEEKEEEKTPPNRPGSIPEEEIPVLPPPPPPSAPPAPPSTPQAAVTAIQQSDGKESSDSMTFDITQVHVFPNVPSDVYELSIANTGDPAGVVSQTSQDVYDAASGTVTVTLNATVNAGKTVTTTVTLKDADGNETTSVYTLTTPQLTSAALKVTQEGSEIILTTTGTYIEPSVGTVTVEISTWIEGSSLSDGTSVSASGGAFESSWHIPLATLQAHAPNGENHAGASATLFWILPEAVDDLYQVYLTDAVSFTPVSVIAQNSGMPAAAAVSPSPAPVTPAPAPVPSLPAGVRVENVRVDAGSYQYDTVHTFTGLPGEPGSIHFFRDGTEIYPNYSTSIANGTLTVTIRDLLLNAGETSTIRTELWYGGLSQQNRQITVTQPLLAANHR